MQQLVNIIPLALCTPLQLHSASFSSISSSGYIGCFDVVADGGFADLHRILDSKMQRLCCVVLYCIALFTLGMPSAMRATLQDA